MLHKKCFYPFLILAYILNVCNFSQAFHFVFIFDWKLMKVGFEQSLRLFGWVYRNVLYGFVTPFFPIQLFYSLHQKWSVQQIFK